MPSKISKIFLKIASKVKNMHFLHKKIYLFFKNLHILIGNMNFGVIFFICIESRLIFNNKLKIFENSHTLTCYGLFK